MADEMLQRLIAATASRSPTAPIQTVTLRFADTESIPGRIGTALLVLAVRCDCDPSHPIDVIYELGNGE